MDEEEEIIYTPYELIKEIIHKDQMSQKYRDFLEFIGYEIEDIEEQKKYISFFQKALYHENIDIVFWSLVGLETFNNKIMNDSFEGHIYQVYLKYQKKKRYQYTYIIKYTFKIYFEE